MNIRHYIGGSAEASMEHSKESALKELFCNNTRTRRSMIAAGGGALATAGLARLGFLGGAGVTTRSFDRSLPDPPSYRPRGRRRWRGPCRFRGNCNPGERLVHIHARLSPAVKAAIRFDAARLSECNYLMTL
jgi:hypothetical protein